jgi:hypothetical protein
MLTFGGTDAQLIAVTLGAVPAKSNSQRERASATAERIEP